MTRTIVRATETVQGGETEHLKKHAIFVHVIPGIRISVWRIGGDYHSDERRVPADQTQPRGVRGPAVPPVLRGRSRVLRSRRVLLLQLARSLRCRVLHARRRSVRDHRCVVDLRYEKWLKIKVILKIFFLTSSEYESIPNW